MSQALVLVVEDDASLREALEDTLGAAGFAVATAPDGAKALLVMERMRVDLVVSDVQMSPVDGWELLRSLQSKHADVPVVLMTAYGSIEQAVQAMRCGAVDYLAKPFEVDALLDMVGRYLPADDRDEIVAADPRSPRSTFPGMSRRGQRSDRDDLWRKRHREGSFPRDTFTSIRRGTTARSWRSTARLSRRTCSKRYCLAMTKGPLPGLKRVMLVSLSRLKVEPCCSTRSRRWARRCRQSCFECFRSVR